MGIYAVDYEEFEELKKSIENLSLYLQTENDFLRSLISGVRWLSKPQVLSVLKVSESTLWQLTKENKIVCREEGKKTVYDIDSVKSYFASQKAITKRVED